MENNYLKIKSKVYECGDLDGGGKCYLNFLFQIINVSKKNQF